MADKPTTLEDLARLEAASVTKRNQAKVDFLEGQKRLITELPERFFALAQQAREGVRRFNTAAPIEHPVSYSESPAVTVREINGHADYFFEVKRKPNEIMVALRPMTRAGKPDAFLIEGSGTVGLAPMNDRFSLRVDAIIAGKETRYKTVVLNHKVDTPIDELGDRIVMVIVTSQLTRFWNTAPWVGDPPEQGLRR